MRCFVVTALVLVACSSATAPAPTGAVTKPLRVPKVHRPTAAACDGVRRADEPNNVPPEGSGPFIGCRTNATCTAGTNGRCRGNGHDGWTCNYDQCRVDTDCPGKGVCSCEGGFRADNDVCLVAGCRLDADCGAGGYCSPSLGACGHFDKVQTYACHTAADECTDDEECGTGGTCRFEATIGHWKCSTSECAG